MRPFNKKLQAIQKLEILSETQELKPEQIEKINSKSEISEFKLSGELSSKTEEDFNTAILKSAPFWIPSFPDNGYKWVVLPVFLENPTSTLPSKTKFDGNAFFSKMEMQFEWLRKNIGSNLTDVYFSAPFMRKN